MGRSDAYARPALHTLQALEWMQTVRGALQPVAKGPQLLCAAEEQDRA